jgi:hypothetical protein
MLFGEGDMSGWGAAAVGSLISAALIGAGAFAVRYFRGKGGFVRDKAAATVTLSAEERKARREREDADRQARRDEEDADRKHEEAERKHDALMLKEYKQLVAELKAERAADREVIHEVRKEVYAVTNKLNACEIKLAVCERECSHRDERIAGLERALAAAGIAVDGGSKTRPALREDGR